MSMRDPERIDEVLDELEEYWKDHPDLRLGQIIGNIAQESGFDDAYYMEDGTVIRYLERENE